MSSNGNNQEIVSHTAKPEKQKRRSLSGEKKFQIFLEAQDDKPVGEILRREGLYSADLARIREQVHEGAVERLSAKPGPRQASVPRNEWGFVGPIKGIRLKTEVKYGILNAISEVKEEGVSNRRSCELFMIQQRRVIRWQKRQTMGLGLEDQKPGPQRALHALLSEEKEQIFESGRA